MTARELAIARWNAGDYVWFWTVLGCAARSGVTVEAMMQVALQSHDWVETRA